MARTVSSRDHEEDVELPAQQQVDGDAHERANARAVGAFHAATGPVQRKVDQEAEVSEGEAEERSRQLHAAPAAAPAAEATHELPAEVRAKMEHAFQADFSAVRIHEGPAAQDLGARAFTRGSDIYFAPGQYDPNSERGQALLGHELAHVVQQTQGRVAASNQGKTGDVVEDESLELEADDLGARAARGEVVADAARAGEERVAAPEAAAPMQFNGFATLDEALDNLSDSSAKHILAAKHAWNLVIDEFKAPEGEKPEHEIPEGSWDSVKAILKQVAADGAESKYKSVWKKELAVNGQTVVLTYVKIGQGFRVSDGWVQTK